MAGHVQEQFTYAICRRDGKELLFDHRRDPYQKRDLAGDRAFAATQSHVRERSERWRREHCDEFLNCSAYQPRWTTDRNITNTATGTRQDLQALRGVLAKRFRGDVGDRSVGVPTLT